MKSLFLAFTLLLTPAAATTIIVPLDLQPGDTYRIIFSTSSTTNAFSTDIDTYNDFVTAAANSDPGLASLNTTWRVLGSTAAVNVLTNASLSLSDLTTRFYNTQGQLITIGVGNSSSGPFARGLYSGSLLSLTASISDETGADPAPYPSLAFTGTDYNGNTITNQALGDERVRAGYPVSTSASWTYSEQPSQSESWALFGISGILTVPSADPAAVPEPSMLALTGVLTIFALIAHYRRAK